MPNLALHVKAGSARAYWVREHLFRFLATAEESFYVLDGDVTFQIGSERFAASTGDYIHIPRGTLHRFEGGLRPARLLASYAPASDELPFLELGVPADVDQPVPATMDPP